MKKLLVSMLVLGMLCGCQKDTQSIDLTESMSAVEEVAPYLKEMALMDLTKEDIATILNIDEAYLDEAIGKSSMISVHVDMVLALTANSDHVDEVYEAVQDYQKQMAEDSFQYPMNLAVNANAMVLKQGNQIYYVRLSYQGEDSFDLDETQQAQKIKEINNQALEAIKDLY